MIIEYYKNFIEIVECGNISAAARKLCIAQPALSNQLKVIEKEYGAVLLYRGARFVELTEAGEVLYRRAKAICDLEEGARKEISDKALGMEGTLHLAMTPTSSSKFLENFILNFAEKYPKVRIEMHEATSFEVAECVANGISEIGFVSAPISNRHLFNMYPIEQELIKVVVPTTHTLAHKRSMQLEELQGSEVIVHRGCMEALAAEAKRKELKINITAITTSRKTTMEWAKLRNRIALVPFGKGETVDLSKMTLVEINNSSMSIPRGLITKKGIPLTKIARNFLKLNESFIEKEKALFFKGLYKVEIGEEKS